MPTLHDVQSAVCRSLVAGEDAPAAAHVLADALAPEARLNVYRNTFIGALTSALRLSFPAVHRIVGAAFFESAARRFIEQDPPRGAWLDVYGDAFPTFLEGYAPTASLPYIAGVARLEWAVNRALHADDIAAVDAAQLSAVDPERQDRIAFVPHPSVGLVRADHPVDAIWRAVLAQDDAAMAEIDLEEGPVSLLVERSASGVEVTRLSEVAWRFAAALLASRPLQDAIDEIPETDPTVLLASHLAAGRIIGFELSEPNGAAAAPETST